MKDLFSFRRALAILIKEFTQLGRDSVTLRMIVLIPIIQLLLFGYALNTDPKHLPTAVLSQDNSLLARSVLAGLNNTEYFSIDYIIDSEPQGHALLQQGAVLFVITIPQNFERSLIRKEKPNILIEADASDPVATSGALAAANGMLNTVLAHDLTGALSNLTGNPPAMEFRLHKQYNPEGFTRYNIVPGLIPIILTMTGIMMTALAMTRERERGTMENLLAMPVSPLEVMAGKIFPYVLIGFMQSAIIIIVAKFLFSVPIVGSIALLAGMLLIFITCNMALGFTLSAIALNQTQAMQMTVMITLPSFLLSGFLFPFKGMPEWAQIAGNLMPATHFIVISRAILLKGGNLNDIWPHVWPLIIMMLIITFVAMKRYRRTLD
jgi:ABC-2 type transport system permease protein